MAQLLNRNKSGFELSIHVRESPESEWVLLTLRIFHQGQISFATDINECRSVDISELERFVKGVIASSLQGTPFSFKPRQENEFVYRQHPGCERVYFAIDMDRGTDCRLSGNYIAVDFKTTTQDVMKFIDELERELDTLYANAEVKSS